MLRNINNFVKKQFSTSTAITNFGIKKPNNLYYNLSYKKLREHELKNNEGVICKTKYGNTFSIDTGKFTGRSPKDKWIVKTAKSDSEKKIWWGEINQELTEEKFNKILEKQFLILIR